MYFCIFYVFEGVWLRHAVKILRLITCAVSQKRLRSTVVYKFVCRCDCRYVGRTSQTLQDRTNHYVLKSIRLYIKKNRLVPMQKCKTISLFPLLPTVIQQWYLTAYCSSCRLNFYLNVGTAVDSRAINSLLVYCRYKFALKPNVLHKLLKWI